MKIIKRRLIEDYVTVGGYPGEHLLVCPVCNQVLDTIQN